MANREIRIPSVPVERLRELFRYDAESGQLHRLSVAKANRYPRQTRIKTAYREISVDGLRLYAHQVVWALHYGEWASISIDHKDGDKQNNRIGNLRLATWSQQQANQGLSKHNTSGLKGVSWHKQRKKWSARISLGPKKAKHLGLFVTKEEAHAAYVSAAITLHGEFARAK